LPQKNIQMDIIKEIHEIMCRKIWINKMNENCVKQDKQAKCEQQNQQRYKMNKKND
jgi:hypothetical protein